VILFAVRTSGAGGTSDKFPMSSQNSQGAFVLPALKVGIRHKQEME
jgi:hypothetical protein